MPASRQVLGGRVADIAKATLTPACRRPSKLRRRSLKLSPVMADFVAKLFSSPRRAILIPEIKLSDVRARAITTRDEWRSLRLDGPQRRSDVVHALDAGWIAPRPDQDEVVVHHRIAAHSETIGDELL